MILSALLLPFTMNSYGKSIEAKVKELQEVQLKKEIEISEISDLIAKRYASFEHYNENALYFWRSVQEKKTEWLQRNDVLSKNGQQADQAEMEELFDHFFKTIDADFNAAKDIEKLIEEVSFDQESFDTIRISVLRVVLEKRLINKLVLKYNALIQELIKIDQELITLKK
jgi:hypothetical protein